MKYYRGSKKKKNYFEGWYFKQSSTDYSIAFIPSIIFDNKKKPRALIQVITDSFSECFYFDYLDFYALKNKLFVKIKNNVFSEQGIQLNLENDKYTIKAELSFDKFTTIKPIMGFFSNLPFLQCYHDIISMNHLVNGVVTINGNKYNFNKSYGYIEKDAGRDFPNQYLWIQTNSFDKDVSFSMSIASIPFYGYNFTGFITSLIYEQKEYRFATYNNSKIKTFKKNHIVLENKNYLLEISYYPSKSYPLYAPIKGTMCRIIEESLDGNLTLKLYSKGLLVFMATSKQAGIEDLF